MNAVCPDGEGQITVQAAPCLRATSIGPKVSFLKCDRPSEPFDHDMVAPRLHAWPRLSRNREPLHEYLAAEPVDHHQIHKAPRHRDINDTHGPHVVGTGDPQVP